MVQPIITSARVASPQAIQNTLNRNQGINKPVQQPTLERYTPPGSDVYGSYSPKMLQHAKENSEYGSPLQKAASNLYLSTNKVASDYEKQLAKNKGFDITKGEQSETGNQFVDFTKDVQAKLAQTPANTLRALSAGALAISDVLTLNAEAAEKSIKSGNTDYLGKSLSATGKGTKSALAGYGENLRATLENPEDLTVLGLTALATGGVGGLAGRIGTGIKPGINITKTRTGGKNTGGVKSSDTVITIGNPDKPLIGFGRKTDTSIPVSEGNIKLTETNTLTFVRTRNKAAGIRTIKQEGTKRTNTSINTISSKGAGKQNTILKESKVLKSREIATGSLKKDGNLKTRDSVKNTVTRGQKGKQMTQNGKRISISRMEETATRTQSRKYRDSVGQVMRDKSSAKIRVSNDFYMDFDNKSGTLLTGKTTKPKEKVKIVDDNLINLNGTIALNRVRGKARNGKGRVTETAKTDTIKLKSTETRNVSKPNTKTSRKRISSTLKPNARKRVKKSKSTAIIPSGSRASARPGQQFRGTNNTAKTTNNKKTGGTGNRETTASNGMKYKTRTETKQTGKQNTAQKQQLLSEQLLQTRTKQANRTDLKTKQTKTVNPKISTKSPTTSQKNKSTVNRTNQKPSGQKQLTNTKQENTRKRKTTTALTLTQTAKPTLKQTTARKQSTAIRQKQKVKQVVLQQKKTRNKTIIRGDEYERKQKRKVSRKPKKAAIRTETINQFGWLGKDTKKAAAPRKIKI